MKKIVFFTLIIISISQLKAQYVGVYAEFEEKTLYFSSDTHLGMGGMDLFKSSNIEDKEEHWKKPINLGHPINTLFDDLNISYAKNRRYANMAKRFDDSFGDWDIYRLTFYDVKDEYTLLSG